MVLNFQIETQTDCVVKSSNQPNYLESKYPPQKKRDLTKLWSKGAN